MLGNLSNLNGVLGTAAIPYRISTGCLVLPQYPTEPSGKVGYELDTSIRQVGKFGMTSTTGTLHFGEVNIPNTGGIYVSTSTKVVQYGRNTLPKFTGVFGTTAIPYPIFR